MTSSTSLDMLEAHDTAATHVLCGTYNFDPEFFEGHLLRHVAAFAGAERVTILADANEVARTAAEGRAAQANRRYLLHGVECGLGCFHAKFVLAVSEDAARLTVGSANLTASGWLRNLELVETWDAAPDDTDPEGVFSSVLAFAERMVARSRHHGASRSLREIRQTAPWLGGGRREPGALLTSATAPLLDQLEDRVRALDGELESIEILSPYFDAGPALFDEIVRRFGRVRIRIYVAPQQGLPSGLARWSETSGVSVETTLVTPKEDAPERPVHAKAILFRCAGSDVIAFGSANATRAALMGAPAANEELLLLRAGRRAKRSPLQGLLGQVGALSRIAIEDLPVSPSEDDRPALSFAVAIEEATLDDDRITFRVRGDVPPDTRARVRGVTDGAAVGPIAAFEDGWRTAPLSDTERLFRGAVRLALVDPEERLRSAEVFVDALLEDAGGGGAVRRAIKRAAMNSLGFELALEELRQSSDPQALVEFFWFLDIRGVGRAPGVHAARTHDLRAAYVPKQPLDILAQLDLDHALDAFWRRHLRRLGRIAEDPDPHHAPVALHLLAALHGALEVQAGEFLALLASCTTLSADHWKSLRDVMDRVLRRYLELSRVLAAIDAAANAKLRKALAKDGDELRRGYDRVTRWKAEVDGAVPRIRVAVPGRAAVPAQFFRGNVVTRWGEYRREVDGNMQPLLRRLSA